MRSSRSWMGAWSSAASPGTAPAGAEPSMGEPVGGAVIVDPEGGVVDGVVSVGHANRLDAPVSFDAARAALRTAD